METGHISKNLQVMACSIKHFELFFSNMFKLDEKDSLDSKMSDLVKFSTVACFHGYITLCSFLKLILVQFWCLTTHFEAYDLLYKNLSSNCLQSTYKMAKTCPKIANVSNFCTYFAIFRCLRGTLVVISAQILVEEVLNFNMNTQTSKSDKK